MYHGIIIDQEFKDKNYPEKFKIFAKKKDDDWRIYGIEIEESKVDEIIKNIQENIKETGNWYAHLYNDTELIVIFKNKVFIVTPNSWSWKPIIEYGRNLNIPEEQLDFWPNRFQDERHYFC